MAPPRSELSLSRAYTGHTWLCKLAWATRHFCRRIPWLFQFREAELGSREKLYTPRRESLAAWRRRGSPWRTRQARHAACLNRAASRAHGRNEWFLLAKGMDRRNLPIPLGLSRRCNPQKRGGYDVGDDTRFPDAVRLTRPSRIGRHVLFVFVSASWNHSNRRRLVDRSPAPAPT